MAHRVIKKLKPFKKTEDFLWAPRVKKKKKKILGKNKISYGAQSNQTFEAFLKYLEKICIHGSSTDSFT